MSPDRTTAPKLIFFLFAFFLPSNVCGNPCDTAAFKEIVSRAGTSLRALNDTNSKTFQQKLAALRARSGLSEPDFLAKATPLVKDDVTAAIDTSTQALLAQVETIGNGDVSSETIRCSMLDELKTLMDKVVSNTASKWQHMIAKVTGASEAPKPASPQK